MKHFFILFFLLITSLSHTYAQEICDNGIDDDGDGLIDCVDSDCICDKCSEKQTNIWYFGYRAGLDFNSGTPQALSNGQVSTHEGCATMADANGNLLFYTDGTTVWNRNHLIMVNGTGLMGEASSTQAAVTVPHPSDPTLYYIFTVDYASGTRGLRYSIVDLSLNAGLGGITTKNILLLASTTEKIGVVRHCNNRDFWIIGHEYNTNRFFVYALTPSGLNTTPNIQSIGMAHDGGTANKLGYMKASPNGQKLACAIFYKNTVNVFDFDNSTGTLSNPINITTPLLNGAYGVEFSKDAQIIYATALESPAKLLQFDLSSNNAATILASRITLAQTVARYEFGSLQMASNGIIYVARRNVSITPYRTFLATINNPSTLGVGASFQDNAISVLPGGSGLSLPSFVQGYDYNIRVKIDSISTQLQDTLCTSTGRSTYQLKGTFESCSLDTILWQHKGANTFYSSTDSSITLDITTVGKDTIIAEIRTYCQSIFDTLIIPTIICPEICNNGIDDDGDRLIDQFDTLDCPCTNVSCNRSTFNTCTTCSHSPSVMNNWAINTIWQSSYNSPSVPFLIPAVGDLDGDCLPEIVLVDNDSIFILDGVTGQTKYRIGGLAGLGLAANYWGNLAIGDVDADGLGDIFVLSAATNGIATKQRLVRFEYNGSNGFNQIFLANEEIGPYIGYDPVAGQRYYLMSISIADINEDNRPEIVVGNEIFDAINGDLITQGGATNSLGAALAWGGTNSYGKLTTGSVLVDILPDNFCTNCEGLELVAGNMIYSIAIPEGGGLGSGVMNVEVTNATISDGFNSIADLDFDGQLEIITGWGTGAANRFTISAWNPLTGITYDEFTVGQSGSIGLGRIAIADLDNATPRDMEITFHIHPSLYTYKFNPISKTFSNLATIPVNDGSRTGVTVFDFDGDGANEVIYRDETTLRLLSGGTLSSVVTPIPCRSGTDVEYPIVADVNGDGQTEILIGCGNRLHLYGNGQIGEQWSSSRKVWNQWTYFYTNINDDLTIPRQQQNPHLVADSLLLNTFLKQFGNPNTPLPDATIRITNTLYVPTDSSDISVEICNTGNNTLPANTPITFYNGNPTISSPTVIAAIRPLGQHLEAGNCITQTHRVRGASGSVHAVINCDNSTPPVFNFNTNFPMTTISECDYTNNMSNQALLLGTDLIDYDVKKQAKTAVISWKFNRPENYQTVTVERSSNAFAFQSIAAAILPQKNFYWDNNPLNKDNYYRLKLKKLDGSIEYTSIKQLYFESNKVDLLTIPNPFSSNFTIQISSKQNHTIQSVELINVLGQIVYHQKTSGKTSLSLPVQSLPAGTYWLSVQVGNQWLKRKVIKQ